MAWKEIFALVALVSIASAAIKSKHPPQHHHHDEHDHNSVHADLDTEIAPQNLVHEQSSPTQEDIVTKDVETQDVVKVEVAEDVKKEYILKSRQEDTDDQIEDPENELKEKALWVDCDFNAASRLSCFDCRIRLICKYPGGGVLVGCNYSLKPYCNNGICSAVPSTACA